MLAPAFPAEAQTAFQDGQSAFRQGKYDSAATLFGEACASGTPLGCTFLGLMHELGSGMEQSEETAAVYYRMGCEQGDMEGCVVLGENLLDHADYSGSAPYLGRACDRGHLKACFDLAPLYLSGLGGMPADPAISASMLGRGCYGGFGPSCRELGRYYSEGTALARDEGVANALFGKACNLDDSATCVELGDRCLNGTHGVERDRVKALGWYTSACMLGDETGCARAQSLEASQI